MEAKCLSITSVKQPKARAMQKKGIKCGTRERRRAAERLVAIFKDNANHKYRWEPVTVHTIIFLCTCIARKWKKNFYDMSCSREIPGLRQKLLAENLWFLWRRSKQMSSSNLTGFSWP